MENVVIEITFPPPGFDYFIQKETSLGIKRVIAQFYSLLNQWLGTKKNTHIKYTTSNEVE